MGLRLTRTPRFTSWGFASKVRAPSTLDAPHLVVEIAGGGPFLLRDRGFAQALRRSAKDPIAEGQIRVASPVHPKLVSAEMESHGFMRAAHEQRIPATVIKGISDDGDEEKAALEKKTGGFYRALACSNAGLVALHMLRYLGGRRASP